VTGLVPVDDPQPAFRGRAVKEEGMADIDDRTRAAVRRGYWITTLIFGVGILGLWAVTGDIAPAATTLGLVCLGLCFAVLANSSSGIAPRRKLTSKEQVGMVGVCILAIGLAVAGLLAGEDHLATARACWLTALGVVALAASYCLARVSASD
jgi:hypothetical protein